jgi:hypothetical protein
MLGEGGRLCELAGERLCLSPEAGTVASSIGLSGPDSLRGKLVVIAQPEFFRAMYPMGADAGAKLSVDQLADWASEMANQLLGRIKNMLSLRALNFSLSIPTVLQGDCMQLLCRDRPSCIERCVRVDGHAVDLLLELERPGGGPLLGQNESVATQSEGSALLF